MKYNTKLTTKCMFSINFATLGKDIQNFYAQYFLHVEFYGLLKFKNNFYAAKFLSQIKLLSILFYVSLNITLITKHYYIKNIRNL